MSEYLFNLPLENLNVATVGLHVPLTTGLSREGLLDPVELPVTILETQTNYGVIADEYHQLTDTTNGSVRVFDGLRSRTRVDDGGWLTTNGGNILQYDITQPFLAFEARLGKEAVTDLVALAGLAKVIRGLSTPIQDMKVEAVPGFNNRFVVL